MRKDPLFRPIEAFIATACYVRTTSAPVIAEPVSFDRDQRPMSALAYV